MNATARNIPIVKFVPYCLWIISTPEDFVHEITIVQVRFIHSKSHWCVGWENPFTNHKIHFDILSKDTKNFSMSMKQRWHLHLNQLNYSKTYLVRINWTVLKVKWIVTSHPHNRITWRIKIKQHQRRIMKSPTKSSKPK